MSRSNHVASRSSHDRPFLRKETINARLLRFGAQVCFSSASLFQKGATTTNAHLKKLKRDLVLIINVHLHAKNYSNLLKQFFKSDYSLKINKQIKCAILGTGALLLAYLYDSRGTRPAFFLVLLITSSLICF